MEFVIEIAKQIGVIAGVVLASGVTTTLLVQALKWKFVSVPASRYPIPTAIILSLIVSLVAVQMTGLVLLDSVAGWAILFGATILTSTQIYDLVHDRVKENGQA